MLGQPIFPGDSGVDQLVEIIKVLGTPTREQIKEMNPNYTEFKFPQIKAHPWPKVMMMNHRIMFLTHSVWYGRCSEQEPVRRRSTWCRGCWSTRPVLGYLRSRPAPTASLTSYERRDQSCPMAETCPNCSTLLSRSWRSSLVLTVSWYLRTWAAQERREKRGPRPLRQLPNRINRLVTFLANIFDLSEFELILFPLPGWSYDPTLNIIIEKEINNIF